MLDTRGSSWNIDEVRLGGGADVIVHSRTLAHPIVFRPLVEDFLCVCVCGMIQRNQVVLTYFLNATGDVRRVVSWPWPLVGTDLSGSA